MSLRIGLYDFFSFTIPGGCYFFLVIYVYFDVTNNINLSNYLTKINLSHVLIFAILSYLAGHLFGAMSKFFWKIISKLFKAKDIQQQALRHMSDTYPEFINRFKGDNWKILYAFIQKENMDNVSEIMWMNATKLMLRNLSFCFLMLSFYTFVRFFASNFAVEYIIISAAAIFLMFVTKIRSDEFMGFYFSMLYNAGIAYSTDFHKFITEPREKK